MSNAVNDASLGADTYFVKADTFVLPGGVLGTGFLQVNNGCFGNVTPDLPSGDAADTADAPVLDYSGCIVAPGYVDTHIHGFVGHDVMDCDPEGVNLASRALATHGTTSWVPTTLTQRASEIERACASVYEAKAMRGDDFLGARIEGIYLEGPFFTERHKGAQNPEFMCDPDVELLKRWQKAAHGLIRKSALAPERDGSVAYCSALREMGVVSVLGHSDATYEQGMAAVAAGATSFVHTYNGMSGLNHRNAGLVGCAMTTSQTYPELICDGMHVLPEAIKALVATRGWEWICLVTDCLRCGGMPEGDYMLGDFPIRMQDNLAHLILAEGTLGSIAGSVLTLEQAVRNLVKWQVVTFDKAIRMATEVAAVSAGIEKTCGFILPGRQADFNVLKQDLTLAATYIGGQKVTNEAC